MNNSSTKFWTQFSIYISRKPYEINYEIIDSQLIETNSSRVVHGPISSTQTQPNQTQPNLIQRTKIGQA